MTGILAPADAAETANTITRILPPSLVLAFDASFIRSSQLYHEFVDRLALQVFRATGLEAAAREGGAPEEIVARAGLDSRRAVLPVDWMLRRLAQRGIVVETIAGDTLRYHQARGDLPELDPALIREQQRREDHSWLPSYVMAETVAQDYPKFLRGERTGEEILFSPARLRLWVEFFSNDNRLYAVNNLVGAAAIEEWMPSGPTNILELGGGLGSAAVAVLQRLRTAGRWSEVAQYRFTELVPAFLRRGESILRTQFPEASFLRFGSLDMNLPFTDQGVDPESFSLIYAVNTLHVARRLDITLRHAFGALIPGGQLIIAECIRPAPRQPIDVEFIFSLMETFRCPELHPVYRPTGGFLTPELWQSAMEAAGFTDVRVLPDIARIRGRFPSFCVGAIGARRPYG